MKTTMISKRRLALVAAFAAAVGCGGSGGSHDAASSASTAPATSLSQPAPTTSTSIAPSPSPSPSPISTQTNPNPQVAPPQIVKLHGVAEFRTQGGVASTVIVRDDDYAEFSVRNDQVLRVAGVKDGQTIAIDSEIAPVTTAAGSPTVVDVTSFVADTGDLHGRYVVRWTGRWPRRIRHVYFQEDGGDLYTLTGALATQALATPKALIWRGLRVTGLVTSAPTLNTPGTLDVTSYSFDRVLERRVTGGMLWVNDSLSIELGTKWGESWFSNRFNRLHPVHRGGTLSRADLRALDKLTKTADLFNKKDVYRNHPLPDVPWTTLVYRTIDKEKTITIIPIANVPQEILDVLKKMNDLNATLPII